MPKKIALAQVQQLASKLSREDRLTLFDYLAKLPDSGLIYHAPVSDPSSMVLPSNPTQEILALNIQMGWGVTGDGAHVFSVEGREVLSIKFNPLNYAEFTFQKLKDKALQLNAAGEGHDLLQQMIRDDSQKKGTNLTEEQVNEIERKMLDWYAQKLVKDSLIELATTIDQNINQAGMAVLAKIVQTAGFAVANSLRDSVGMPEKLKAADVQNIIYKPEWDRLKTIVGLHSTQGGARNIKHAWTDEDRRCLAAKYAELLPIWRDAKTIAFEALKSKVRNRKAEWRNEVLRVYPNLPVDLLESFSAPRGVRPSDNAILHASRECKITGNISIRRLHEIVTEWNKKLGAVQTGT